MLDDAGTSRGKLDAMTMLKTTVVADSGDMVNGPEARYRPGRCARPTVEDEKYGGCSGSARTGRGPSSGSVCRVDAPFRSNALVSYGG
jgi:hypothetical protein